MKFFNILFVSGVLAVTGAVSTVNADITLTYNNQFDINLGTYRSMATGPTSVYLNAGTRIYERSKVGDSKGFIDLEPGPFGYATLRSLTRDNQGNFIASASHVNGETGNTHSSIYRYNTDGEFLDYVETPLLAMDHTPPESITGYHGNYFIGSYQDGQPSLFLVDSDDGSILREFNYDYNDVDSLRLSGLSYWQNSNLLVAAGSPYGNNGGGLRFYNPSDGSLYDSFTAVELGNLMPGGFTGETIAGLEIEGDKLYISTEHGMVVTFFMDGGPPAVPEPTSAFVLFGLVATGVAIRRRR